MSTPLSQSRQLDLPDALIQFPQVATRVIRSHLRWFTIGVGLVLILPWIVVSKPPSLEPQTLTIIGLAVALGLATSGLIWQRRRVSTLETALKRAEVRHCDSQLTSHFVFNTLNTVGGLVLSDRPRIASRAIGQLGDLMRRTLHDRNRTSISVSEELAFVHDYVSLQRLRFGERLTITEAVDEATLDAAIPPMTLQLLVENAIQHGALKAVGHDRIGIRIHRADRDLVVEVLNGRRAGPSGHSGFGIGLDAVRRRLDRFGGSGASLTITRTSDSFRARVVVPQSLEERR